MEFNDCGSWIRLGTVTTGRDTDVHDTRVHIVGRDGDVALDFEHAFGRDGGRFLRSFIALEPR